MALGRSWLAVPVLLVGLSSGGCLPSHELDKAMRTVVARPLVTQRDVAPSVTRPAVNRALPGQRVRQDDADSMICPVVGFTAVADNFGVPRGQGRTHDGIDMFGTAGLPVVAVVSGRLSLRPGVLGGLVARLVGDDDTSYFYGHLQAFEGVSREVAQGEVIGYLGATGNADGVPHLHFEIRPNRGRPIDPYSSVRAAC
ncbi:MAG: hypothetical protein B7C54_06935 [Acidimicrobiales bacterium mtb01]|nr:M23 family metallopeptidase [Actinomycetota bacterium]TEX44878.1 MAG: hypothetical protein B7C54_06935 [Acidimicrobiales bacterium mtb01]